jgi:hypothetical protein
MASVLQSEFHGNTPVFTIQFLRNSKHITEPNRLLLFGGKVAVYCENHTNTHVHSVFSLKVKV